MAPSWSEAGRTAWRLTVVAGQADLMSTGSRAVAAAELVGSGSTAATACG